MNKINFVNDGQPAINDTNLNQMQDNIENALDTLQNDVENTIKTQIISATLNSDFTKTGTGYEQLTLSSSVSNGTKLTLSVTGGIVIGSDISKVKISARTYFSSVTSGIKWIAVYKNSSVATAAALTMSGRSTLILNPQLIEVQEGDIISLRVNGENPAS